MAWKTRRDKAHGFPAREDNFLQYPP